MNIALVTRSQRKYSLVLVCTDTYPIDHALYHRNDSSRTCMTSCNGFLGLKEFPPSVSSSTAVSPLTTRTKTGVASATRTRSIVRLFAVMRHQNQRGKREPNFYYRRVTKRDRDLLSLLEEQDNFVKAFPPDEKDGSNLYTT